MHRTQLLIEDWQHRALRARADARGQSISQAVREILTAELANPGDVRRRLDELAGIGEGKPDLASEHDVYLYGLRKGRWRRRMAAGGA